MPFAFKLAHRLSRLHELGLGFALAALGACETTRSVSVVTNPTIASVVVTPDSVTLTPGQTTQFSAYGRTTAGDSVPVTATWTATGGSISPTGLFTAGSGTGTYSVDAQVATVHGHGHVHVKTGPVASVTVSPASATGNVGQSAQFTATLKDASGNVLPDSGVTWSSTNTAVVTVSTTGYSTAVGPGSAAIVATSQGKSGQAQVTVNGLSGPGPVASVTVSPASASIAVGATQAFSAVLKDANGNVATGAVTWSSSAATIAGISLTGVVTGLVAGSSTVTATSGGVSGTASVTVTVAPVASVVVSPGSASIVVGATQPFSAVLKDASGNVVTGAVTWSSSAPTIAGISLTGVVTGLVAGTTTITATSGGVSGTAGLTVTVVPPPPPGGWPHEPAGWTTLAEHSGDVLTPTGWSVEWNDSGYLGTALDANAPMSPPGVLQYMWPVGWTNLIGMGALWHDFPTTRKVFVGVWWKPSNPWQGHVSNTNKIQYLFTNSSGSIFMAMYGPPGGPYEIVVYPQFTTSLGRWLTPNVNHVPVVLGQWHRLEWLVDYSGTKGHIQWWMDGVLLGEYSDDPPPPEGLIEYKLHPVWGGAETIAKTETDYYWFDQVHVSAF